MSRYRHLAAIVVVALGFFGWSAPSKAVPISAVAPVDSAAQGNALTTQVHWKRRYYKRRYHRPFRHFRRIHRHRYYYPRRRYYYKRHYYHPRRHLRYRLYYRRHW